MYAVTSVVASIKVVAEYWWFVLFGAIVFGLASSSIKRCLEAMRSSGPPARWCLMPYVAVAVRRLHDTNRSGWWLLLVFVPLGNIVQLIWLCAPARRGATGSTRCRPDDVAAW